MGQWRDHNGFHRSTVETTAAVLSDGLALFNIVGDIRIISLVSECKSTGTPAASTLQYNSTPTVGDAATFSGASASMASCVAGSSISLISGQTTAPAIIVSGANNKSAYPLDVFCPRGVITAVVGTGPTTGTWKHYLVYESISAGAYALPAF